MAGRYSAFTRLHRGGTGSPLVCLHGFLDTWRVWELVLPALERRHDVLAPTLPGHTGGPPIQGDVDASTLVDAVERTMDEAGFQRAHLVGNSLGGWVALQLAARDRAETVVAIAPAGGWAAGDQSYKELLRFQRTLGQQARLAVPYADSALASPEGRRRATRLLSTNYEHIPSELLVHQLLGIARCPAAERMIDYAMRGAWDLEAERVTSPVRILWGTEDKLLPWPRAAARYRYDWLPHADWVVLDGVGHYPQFDVPLETAQLILDFTRLG